MKTENIKAVLSALQEYAGPLEEQEEEVLAAVAELTALETEIATKDEAIRGALSIESLWCPTSDVAQEHEDEAKTLHWMKSILEAALTPPTNPNAGLRCKDIHPNGCPFADLPEDHTIGDHPSPTPPTGMVSVEREKLEDLCDIVFVHRRSRKD